MVNGVLPYFLTSTGSNGAAGMTRWEDGLLKKITQNPSHVICIHCVAYTVNLYSKCNKRWEITLMILIQSSIN